MSNRDPLPSTPDQRSLPLRVLLVVGIAFSALLGLLLCVIALPGLEAPRGQLALCLGLLLLVSAAGGTGRELAERAHDRSAPAPRLEVHDGEPSLHLPRSAGRSRVSSWTLTGISAVLGLGALFAAGAGAVPGAVALAVTAALLLLVAAPWSPTPGGVWFTPTRMVHEHDGTSWEVGWDDVTGSWKGEPVPVMLRPGSRPQVRRTLSAGRHRGRVREGDTLLVESRYLAGGAALTSYVVLQAVGDRAFRAALGTPASLPPRVSR